MRFDLTDLRLFAAIVEAGSITAGAARAHMTLASASQRVRGMEDALGAPLLLRSKAGVRPTEAGRTLVHHARLVHQQMERLRGDLGDYGLGLQGHVRLLCNTSAMTEHLPQVLGAFLAEHPRISVDLEERPSADIVDAVRAGLCDLGVVSDVVDVEDLPHAVFRRDELVLVVPRGHALAQRRRVRLAELADCRFVGLAEDSPLQAHIAGQARRLGQRLVYRVRVRSFEAICRLVEQGIGVGIVPRAAALRAGPGAALRAVSIDEPWADRHLLVCLRDPEALPQHARRMLDHLLADAPAVPSSSIRTRPGALPVRTPADGLR